MSSFPSLSSAFRRSLSLQQTCQLCARRQASKSGKSKRRPKLEIELNASIPKLGNAGERVQVAPGRMRNHLYPSKLALYVVNGRAVQLDGSYGPLRTANESASSSSSSQDISSSITSSSAPVVEESRILQQLEKLGPLRFERRTTGQDMLHGSVTQQNVLTALQEAGVQIQEMNGDWAATAQADALDHGKIKQLGEYIFNLQLKNTSKPIIVHVVNEASSEA